MVKNLPAIWENRVRSLDQDDPLEEGLATHSSILAWRILWTEELRATVRGVTKTGAGLSNTFTFIFGLLQFVQWGYSVLRYGHLFIKYACLHFIFNPRIPLSWS